jgi:hypothetical protein
MNNSTRTIIDEHRQQYEQHWHVLVNEIQCLQTKLYSCQQEQWHMHGSISNRLDSIRVDSFEKKKNCVNSYDD